MCTNLIEDRAEHSLAVGLGNELGGDSFRIGDYLSFLHELERHQTREERKKERRIERIWKVV